VKQKESNKNYHLKNQTESPNKSYYILEKPVMSEDDALLIEECKKNLKKGMRKLFEKYKQQTYRIAYNILHDYHLAQDIVQEAFIRIFKTIKDFDTTKDFYPWLYRITVNLCMDYLKKNSTTKEKGYDDIEPMTRSIEESPFQVCEKSDTKERVWSVLSKMPLKYKIVLVLRDIVGLSPKDIGKIIDCPSGTVRWRTYYARIFFKNIWTGQEHKNNVVFNNCDNGGDV